MVRLVPLTELEFQEYLRRAVRDYAEDKVRAGNWQPDQALTKSTADYEELLPDGIATKNNFLFAVMDEDKNVRVGMIWFALQGEDKTKSAFIYDFLIEENFRRRGFGTQTLRALEDKVRELRVGKIELHVFGHNQPAIDLYKKAGFETTNIVMAKKLI